MLNPIVFNLAALASLAPAALLPFRRGCERDLRYWSLLGLAVAGPVIWAAAQINSAWQTNLSTDLWVGIAASLILFTGLSVFHRQAWRLTPLLVPYLMILGLLACLFGQASGQPLSNLAPPGWIDMHILTAIATLALLTVTASAALASFLQAQALKSKRPNNLTRMLPAVTDSERLFEHLLLLTECVLALGIGSGMATQYAESGRLLAFDHKTLFSLLTVLIIGLLLVGRRVCGVRGQIAARTVLVAYLFLLIGYFGVKFVRQVLLS
ncbi:MAG TPA: cytochrome c biogenesis protein CcsA [Rhodospirillaceae bacterium]|nr:cytochrome c biogenesis protein CcsA [Rhodospirillaceae bacterium]